MNINIKKRTHKNECAFKQRFRMVRLALKLILTFIAESFPIYKYASGKDTLVGYVKTEWFQKK